MTESREITLKTCFDACGPLGGGVEGALLRGWIIAPFPIRAVCFRWSDGATAVAVCGTERPDLAQAFPELPAASHGGFWSVHPRFDPGGRAMLAVSDVHGRWWSVETPLGLGEIRELRAVQVNAEAAAEWEARHNAAQALEKIVIGKWRTTLDVHRPLTVRVDIINKCNLRCVMCHYSDDAVFKRPAKRVSLEDFERWFATVQTGVREVVLSCGDEPLMSPQFSEIVRSITSRYPEVNVMFSTNAMLMDERIARTIVESGVALVMMSVDGVQPETLESVRKGARFDRVIGNAHRLAEIKRRVGSLRPHLVYNFVMMNRNLPEAPAFVEMAQALGAHYVDFRLVVTSEYFFDGAELCETRPGRFNFFRRLALETAARIGLPIYMPPPFPVAEEPEPVPATDELLAPFRALLRGLPAIETDLAGMDPKPAMREYGPRMGELPPVFCERPFSEIMIRNQDEVLPCAWHKNVLGHLATGATVGEIFFGPQFEAVRANMLQPEGDPGCAGCPDQVVASSHHPARLTRRPIPVPAQAEPMDASRYWRDEALRRQEFPVANEQIFLAHAAVATLPRRVVQAELDFATACSLREPDYAGISKRIRAVRERAAQLLPGAEADEISLQGPTALGLSLIAGGLDWRQGDEVVYHHDCYPANVYPWLELQRRGVTPVSIQPACYGEVTIESVAAVLTPRTRMVALASAHFLTGFRIDVDGIGRMLHERGILFCLDAIQTLGAFPLPVGYVDFLSADAHKWMLGPLAIGIVMVKRAHFERVRPILLGAANVKCPDFIAQAEIELPDRADRYEPGVLNTGPLFGMDAGIGLLLEVGVERVGARILELKQRLLAGLAPLGFEAIAPVTGPHASGLLTLCHATREPAPIYTALKAANVVPSLRRDRAGRRYLRFSPHFYNTESEMDRVIELIRALPA